MADFRQELAALINKHSKENGSNTPDFLLAKYLHRCLDLYDETTQQRDAWYGVNLEPGNVRTLNPEEQEFRKLVCRFMGRKFREELAKEICAVQPMHDAGEALAKIDKLLGEAGPNAALVVSIGKNTEVDDENA